MKIQVSRILSVLTLAATVSVFSSHRADAATYTFTVPDAFTTGSDNWSTDLKWDAAPVSASTTSLVFTLQATGNSQTQTTGSVNNIADPFQLNSLTFNSSPSAGNGSLIVALNLSGGALNFVSDGSTTPVINLAGNRTAGQPVQFNVANNVTLGAGTTFTGNGTAAFNFTGILSGSSGFTKTGTSILTLSNSSNDFTGGISLSGGLGIGNVSALGNNVISVTGNSTIAATSGIISNTINVSDGVTLSLQATGASNSTTTFSSAITGTGVGITLVAGGGSVARTVELSSTSNTFTGNITLPTVSGSNDYLSLASMGDGGSIVYGRSGWRSLVTYTGSVNLPLSTRSITLASTFGGFGTSPGLDGNGNPINMFASGGAGVVTISPDMVVVSSANSGVFYFGGSNSGNNTFSGLIADNPGTGTLGIGKWDAGKWIISNASNSFQGNVYIGGGTLSVPNLGALGNGSVIQLGFGNSTGTLEFTGSSNSSTSKQVVVGNLNNNNHSGNGIILNNGTGTLSFTNATFNSQTVPFTASNTLTTRDRTLTLGGSNTGVNEIQGTIQDNNITATNNAWVTVSKIDGGTWVLSGSNTYSGGTSVTGGTLVFRNTAAKPSSGTHAFGASTTLGLGVGGSGFFSEADVTNAFAGTMTGNLAGITVTATTNIGVDTTAGDFTHSADITGSPTKGLTKLGANALILAGTNTYTGATNVNAGTLRVNGSIANSVLTTVASGATIGGSGTIGALTVSSGGFINPGNSPDTLDVVGAYTQAGTYNAEITANTVGNGTTGYDQIIVTGAVDITGGSLLAAFSGTGYAANDLLFILLNDDVDAITGTYAGYADGATVATYDGYNWNISYFADSETNSFTGGNDIALQAVLIPEPKTALLGCLGILLVLRRRR